MKKIAEDILSFFQNQGYVTVCTVDMNGRPHCSCKGVVEIDASGHVYLFDLYQARTYQNLLRDSHLSITSVDEHHFIGYCLKGNAKIVGKDQVPSRIVQAWEEMITRRLTRRIIRNIREESGHPRHPEALLPAPEYLIVLNVEEIVDLTPHHLRRTKGNNG